MAKISQTSAKYIIHATIEIDGVVDRPDVVGAIFGQIEGLLGADLELRELQRSGRIGRIEVAVKSDKGKTVGTITIPSSLDKAETAIVGGALEIIERIGPCGAHIKVTRIEDERIAKRQQVINRAKQLLKHLQDSELPDSQELSTEVTDSVKVSEVIIFGDDKLAAGPDLDNDEIIFVEGRADVVNLLKHGFKNVISVNGTSAPKSLQALAKKKNVTLFCDGDRGGDLIIKELTSICDIDFITKAPDGKEVEELQKKEIHQALRSKMKTADWGKRGSRSKSSNSTKKGKDDSRKSSKKASKQNRREKNDSAPKKAPKLTDEQKKSFSAALKDAKKAKKVYLLDKKGEVLGAVLAADLADTLPNVSDVQAAICGVKLTKDSSQALDKAHIRNIVLKEAYEGMRSTVILEADLK